MATSEKGVTRISVVVPVLNAAGEIGRLIESLLAQVWPPEGAEIIVVDNGSTDGTTEVVRRYPVRLLEERAVRSSYAARNRGWRAATGEWIAFIDSDCVAPPDWLCLLLGTPPAPEVGAVAGEVVALEFATPVQRLTEHFGIIRHATTLPHKALPCFSTANVAVRRDLLESLGGFREDVRYFGDMELSWRMQIERGARLDFQPHALVRHRHRRTWGDLWRHGRQHGQGVAFMRGTYPEHYQISAWEQVLRLGHLARASIRALGGPILVSADPDPGCRGPMAGAVVPGTLVRRDDRRSAARAGLDAGYPAAPRAASGGPFVTGARRGILLLFLVLALGATAAWGVLRQPRPEFTDLLANIEPILPEMVDIPAGPFQMGNPGGTPQELPVHEVELSAYSIGRYEVTNQEYQRFVQATGYVPPIDPIFAEGKNYFGTLPTHPVVEISVTDAMAYCLWLSRRTGQNFHLPTEAQWEKAARGGLELATYPWGEQRLENAARMNLTWSEGTVPVGSYPPNGFGMYDVAGNVNEITSDWYTENYYSKSPRRDPQGPSGFEAYVSLLNPVGRSRLKGRCHVVRGGSYRAPWDWQTKGPDGRLETPVQPGAREYLYQAPYTHFDLGFRVARSAAGSGS